MVLDGTALGDDRRTELSVLSALSLRPLGASAAGWHRTSALRSGMDRRMYTRTRSFAHVPVNGTRQCPARGLFAEAATLDPGLAQQLAVLFLGHALAALLDH